VIERALVQAKLDDLGPAPLNLPLPAAEPATEGDDTAGSLPDAAVENSPEGE
jgi:hypothetical protein